jgi:hypothetical protein
LIERYFVVACLVLVPLALFSVGCGRIYLHSPKSQATAESALKDFQSFREKSGNPYSAMLKNLEKANVATADAQSGAAERRATGYALGLPYKEWGELKTELDNELRAVEKADGSAAAKITELVKDLGQAQDTQGDAQQKLKVAKKALAAQFNKNQRWVAQQALFKHAIQKIAEQSTREKSELTPKDMTGSVREILDVEVSVLEQSATGDVKVVTKKIGTVLHGSLPPEWKGLPEAVRALAGIALDPASSPGIAVTILGLAVDLADAEFRRAQIRVAILERKARVLGGLTRNLADSKRLLGQAIGDLSALPPGERVLASIEARRRPTSPPPGTPVTSPEQAIVGLAARLEVLARAALPSTILASERLRLEVELAAIDHEYSIRLSAVNAQAHEALIGRGLEGLAAYHRGGITPQEIANLIHAAQAVAVGVIAGGL